MIGASIPVGLSVPGDLSGRRAVVSFAERARGAGFTTLLVADRPTGVRPAADPISQATVLATLDDWRLITVCLLPYRHPVHLARTLVDVDALSTQPVILAAALGGDYREEMNAFGITESGQLTTRLEETVEICRKLWTGESAEFKGRYFDFEDITVLPRPSRGTIPIWLAHRARSAGSIERTAKIADGWLASWVSVGRLRRATHEIKEAAERLGRDSSSINICCFIRLHIAATVDAATEIMAHMRSDIYGHSYDPDLVAHLQIGGPVDYCLERLWGLVDAGATELVLQLECNPRDYAKQLAAVTNAIVAPTVIGGVVLRR